MTGRVDDLGEERLALYRAFKGVTGLGDPVQPKNQERQVKGVLKAVFGSSPKFGIVQRKLLGSTVDLVGRAVITPNPDLDMDQVGIPETKAWEIYRPFVVRRLARQGVPAVVAAQLARDQAPAARKALLAEMDARPVIVTRAPVLHRYGVMAFFPRLVKGETLQVPPTIVKGFAADFDGDAMNYHVPASDEAVRDAVEKMLPSKNLLSAATFGVHYLPQNEYVGGLYESTRAGDDKKPERVFQTRADALRALARGDIGPRTRIAVLQPQG
jgi:DNA-directed RNA polymerase subunit beta'